MSTFKTLQDDTLERTTFDSSTASSTARTRIKRFINEIYRRVLRESGLDKLTTVVGSTTITTVAAQNEYAVTASKILTVYDTTRAVVLQETSLRDIRESDPGLTQTNNTADFYAVDKVGATTCTVFLYPTPKDSATVYRVDILGPITALSADGDTPVLPEDFHYLLGTGARMLEAEKMQQWDSYTAAQKELEAGIRKLRFYLAKSRIGKSPINRKGQFGAMYEGSWISFGIAD